MYSLGCAVQQSPHFTTEKTFPGKRWDAVLPLKHPAGKHQRSVLAPYLILGSKAHNMFKVTRMDKTERHHCGGPWPESFLYRSKVLRAKTHTRAPPDKSRISQLGSFVKDVSWGVSKVARSFVELGPFCCCLLRGSTPRSAPTC